MSTFTFRVRACFHPRQPYDVRGWLYCLHLTLGGYPTPALWLFAPVRFNYKRH
jgi:hypothetical protein